MTNFIQVKESWVGGLELQIKALKTRIAKADQMLRASERYLKASETCTYNPQADAVERVAAKSALVEALKLYRREVPSVKDRESQDSK